MFPIVHFIELLRLPTSSLLECIPKKDIRTHMHTGVVHFKKKTHVSAHTYVSIIVGFKNSCIHPPCGQSMEKENITQARYDVSPQVVGKQL